MTPPGQLLQQARIEASDANIEATELHFKISVLHPCWWLREHKAEIQPRGEGKKKKTTPKPKKDEG